MKAYLAAALAVSVCAPASAAPAGPAAAVHRVFDIMREGSQIGTNTFDIARSGDATSVKIVTHVLVKVMYVTAYRYDHSETASYKGNQLVSFTATTNDNGTNHEITAEQKDGKVILTVDGETREAAKGIVPASLWSADVSNKSQLFDTGNGKLLSTKARDLGDEMVEIHGAPLHLRHIKLSGQFDRDLWFDKDGLVKLAMLGTDHSRIVSELRQSTAAR
jgi:hypothetical protein